MERGAGPSEEARKGPLQGKRVERVRQRKGRERGALRAGEESGRRKGCVNAHARGREAEITGGRVAQQIHRDIGPKNPTHSTQYGLEAHS